MKFFLEDVLYEQENANITIYHNNLNRIYKKPFGAIKKGFNAQLNIFVYKDVKIKHINILYKKDGEEFIEKECLIQKECKNGKLVGTIINFNETGVYFYLFKIYYENGDFEFLSCNDLNKSYLSKEIKPFYLFCYESKEQDNLLKKYSNGVMYQIFPDRFYKSLNYNYKESKNKRIIHQKEEEKPLYIFDDPNYEATDFYLGNLIGICEKLEYIKALGVNIIYLNPIFEAAANHRYNTADYFKIDPYLGTIEDFRQLCKKADDLGIKIILDGVFSHTGADSIYFNKYGHYNSLGAYQSTESPYYSWYNFKENKNEYDCWWGFKTLPNVDELNPFFLEFICGENGVARFWLKNGASGWRLDVVDELPDEFLKQFNLAVKQEKQDGIIIGEVWENAVLKESYGKRREYLCGKEIDSTMNYPFRNAIIDLVLYGDSFTFFREVSDILQSYPEHCIFSMMNMLSSHDTQRIITTLALVNENVAQQDMGDYVLSDEQYKKSIYLFKISSAILYFLPGISSIYYGDEVGLYGFKDPYNRRFFPWDSQDEDLLCFYKKLGKIKNKHKSFYNNDNSEFYLHHLAKGVILIQYKLENCLFCCFVNCSDYDYTLNIKGSCFNILLSSDFVKKERNRIITNTKSFVIYKEEQIKEDGV